ncbi:hypothetical protein SDC9_105781 [bioreactor metagenome]|uniref:PTS EIIA type-4 domain-containing protein n=1 Tax=bioreactor metagenome TaxID=1076179 RepID=A0A645B1J7_9ZZZZ|nr:PTS sugar transporter subunit IIA [Erysipelotrichaceae bacterium]
MVGVIITGHGQFAQGIYSSLTMIAGHQEDVEVVTFDGTDTEETLSNNLLTAISVLNHCEGIVIMCDLLGGSPFKAAATLSIENPKIHVIYGVNLGMLLEFSLTRLYVDNLEESLNKLLLSGQKSIGKYQFKPIEQETIEDGI